PAGTGTESQIGLASRSNPIGIVTGPDNNMYMAMAQGVVVLTDPAGNKVVLKEQTPMLDSRPIQRLTKPFALGTTKIAMFAVESHTKQIAEITHPPPPPPPPPPGGGGGT